MGDLHLALLGHGTVGAEVARLLHVHADEYRARLGRRLNVKTILVRDRSRHQTSQFPTAKFVSDLDAVVNDPAIDIAVEVMGPLETSSAAVARCLEAGKHVVTANKALLADRGR